MTNCPFRKIISRRSGGVTRTRSRWRQSRRSAAPPDRRARLCLRLSGGWCAKLHSDLGQTGNPSPADGLQLFVTDLMKAGPQQRSDHDYGTRGDWQVVDGLSGGSLSLALRFRAADAGRPCKNFYRVARPRSADQPYLPKNQRQNRFHQPDASHSLPMCGMNALRAPCGFFMLMVKPCKPPKGSPDWLQHRERYAARSVCGLPGPMLAWAKTTRAKPIAAAANANPIFHFIGRLLQV